MWLKRLVYILIVYSLICSLVSKIMSTYTKYLFSYLVIWHSVPSHFHLCNKLSFQCQWCYQYILEHLKISMFHYIHDYIDQSEEKLVRLCLHQIYTNLSLTKADRHLLCIETVELNRIIFLIHICARQTLANVG